jgi:CheY-like chemotaxis protein
MLRNIRGSAHHLLGVINDVLDLSRVEAGKLTLSREPFSLTDVLDALGAVIGGRAKEKGLALRFDVAPDVPRDLDGDSVRLQQVLVNLAGNAVKFTDHGEVTVAVEVESRPSQEEVVLRFSVHDTGVGIPKSELHRLFESFTQLDASVTRRYGGTGLGLAISRRLVNLMGGVIDARSTPGSGSTFFFTARFGIAAVTQRETPIATASAIRFDGAEVLLVEDNAINRLIAEEMLKTAGLRVTSAASGSEALAAARTRDFSLVMMDVQMPDMDGIEATRLLKSEPHYRARPVIALTAHAMSGDRERFLAAGMDDYVTKPIEEEALLRVIARWIPEHVAT